MSDDRAHEDRAHLRLLEALLFAASEPVEEGELAAHLPEGVALRPLLDRLAADYAERGVNLVKRGRAWAFRTAPDLGHRLQRVAEAPRRLTRAATETLAIIAYHQPVTRAEIEDIRGVAVSKGTIDVLFEAGWVRPAGRRRSPGRPVEWRTTTAFLDHFELESLKDLPGIEELKAAGLVDVGRGIADFAGDEQDELPLDGAGDDKRAEGTAPELEPDPEDEPL